MALRVNMEAFVQDLLACSSLSIASLVIAGTALDAASIASMQAWTIYDIASSKQCGTESSTMEDVLRPMVSETKWSKMKQIAKSRTKAVRLVLDGCSDPLNVAAIIRSIDAFGVQFVDVVQVPEAKASNRIHSKKHGVANAVAKGSDKWVTLCTWDSVSACVESLKKKDT